MCLLERLVETQSDGFVSPWFETEDGVKLGAWAAAQRRAKALGLLTTDQVCLWEGKEKKREREKVCVTIF
jgi:hypothetical protein